MENELMPDAEREPHCAHNIFVCHSVTPINIVSLYFNFIFFFLFRFSFQIVDGSRYPSEFLLNSSDRVCIHSVTLKLLLCKIELQPIANGKLCILKFRKKKSKQSKKQIMQIDTSKRLGKKYNLNHLKTVRPMSFQSHDSGGDSQSSGHHNHFVINFSNKTREFAWFRCKHRTNA